jgi:hypothetical protein
VAITFAQAKAIVRAAEKCTWTQGTYLIEDEVSRTPPIYLVVRGAAEAMGDRPDPNYIIVPGLVPPVDKRTLWRSSMWSHTCRRLPGAST